MLLSLSTACLYALPLRATLRLAAEAGFDGVELVMAPEVWLRGAASVRALAREYGLGILSVHQALWRYNPRGGHSAIGDAVRAALELECPCVVLHGPATARWGAREAQDWLRTLERCQERTLGSGTRLTLENPGMYNAVDAHNVLGPVSTLVNFARRYGLEITLDTCHCGTAGVGLLQAYATVRERLANVHFSDLKCGHPAFDSHLLYTLSVHHQMPGDGCLPLAPFVAQLAADGYAGPLSMEISAVALRAWAPGELRRRLVRAAEYVREIAR